MFEIKTMNNIAQQGLDELAANGLILNVDSEDPDGLLIRSAKLHDAAFGSRLLAIARAGVGKAEVEQIDCPQAPARPPHRKACGREVAQGRPRVRG